MATLYPSWRHNSRTPFVGPDGEYTIRTLKHTTVQVRPGTPSLLSFSLSLLIICKDHLRVWLGWSVFGRTLYQQICRRCPSTSMHDFVAWLKIVVTLMFYKCTFKALFANRNSMFKHLPMEWGLSHKQFLDMWRALLPKVGVPFTHLI
jgi:hypothetical protein